MRPRRILLALVVVAAATLVAAAGCGTLLTPLERSFLYRPWPTDPARLASVASSGNGIEEIHLDTSDGVKLHGWLKRPPALRNGERFPLVIVFGGVRREISWMIPLAEQPRGWGWLFVNYRGYGLSEGAPSEQIVLDDAKLTYDYAAARPDVDPANIVLLGRSLGSYVAVAVAAERKVRGTILATPFDSFAALGERRYPMLPLGLIVGGRYDSAALAPGILVPALFVLAERDNVTPVEHGEALARAWGGPKRVVMLANARHWGIERRHEFWQSVGEFLGTLPRQAL